MGTSGQVAEPAQRPPRVRDAVGMSGRAAGPAQRVRRVRIAAATALALLLPAAPPPASGAAEAAADAVATVSQLVVSATVVEVRNGTTGLERLLRWAFDQFTARGLATPRVASVTFRARDTCTGVTGWISGGEVTVCFVEHEACLDPACTQWRPWVKRTAMHELAHAWMSEQLTTDRIEEFLVATGLPTWSSDAHPWELRGVELAAETIAWASQDQPARINARLGNPSCADLTRYYRVLTGHALDPNPHCSRSERGDRPPGGPPTQKAWTHREPSPSGSTCTIELTAAGADARLAPTATTAPAPARAQRHPCTPVTARSARVAERIREWHPSAPTAARVRAHGGTRSAVVDPSLTIVHMRHFALTSQAEPPAHHTVPP